MQWLMHGNLTPAVADALIRHGHTVHRIPALGLGESPAHADILKGAQSKQWDLITTDQALATAPFELDHWFPRSIVFLQLKGEDVEQDDAIDRLFERYKRLAPRRLYTVTETRVKVRQLPGEP